MTLRFSSFWVPSLCACLLTLLFSPPVNSQEFSADEIALLCGGAIGVRSSGGDVEMQLQGEEFRVEAEGQNSEVVIYREGSILARLEDTDDYFDCVFRLTGREQDQGAQFQVLEGRVSQMHYPESEANTAMTDNDRLSEFVQENAGNVVYMRLRDMCCGIYPINYFISQICAPTETMDLEREFGTEFHLIRLPLHSFSDYEARYPEIMHDGSGDWDLTRNSLTTLFTRDSFLPDDEEYLIDDARCSPTIAIQTGRYSDSAGCGTSCYFDDFQGFYLIQSRVTRHSSYFVLTEQDATPTEWSAASRALSTRAD